MAEFLAKRIARTFIRKFHIEEESWDLYYLGIEVITTTVLTSLLIIACGILLNNCVGSMAFLLLFVWYPVCLLWRYFGCMRFPHRLG